MKYEIANILCVPITLITFCFVTRWTQESKYSKCLAPSSAMRLHYFTADTNFRRSQSAILGVWPCFSDGLQLAICWEYMAGSGVGGEAG